MLAETPHWQPAEPSLHTWGPEEFQITQDTQGTLCQHTRAAARHKTAASFYSRTYLVCNKWQPLTDSNISRDTKTVTSLVTAAMHWQRTHTQSLGVPTTKLQSIGEPSLTHTMQYQQHWLTASLPRQILMPCTESRPSGPQRQTRATDGARQCLQRGAAQ